MWNDLSKPQKKTSDVQQHRHTSTQETEPQNPEENTLSSGGELQSPEFDLLSGDLNVSVYVTKLIKLITPKASSLRKGNTINFTNFKQNSSLSPSSSDSSSPTADENAKKAKKEAHIQAKNALTNALRKATSDEIFEELKTVRMLPNLDADVTNFIDTIFIFFAQKITNHEQPPELTLADTNPLVKTSASVDKDSVILQVQDIRRKLVSNNIKMGTKESDALISEAGSLIMDYLISVTGTKQQKQLLDRTVQEYMPIKQRLDTAQDNDFWNIYLSPEAKEGRKKMRDARRALEQNFQDHDKALRDIIHNIKKKPFPTNDHRFAPHEQMTPKDAGHVLEDVITYYPADWVEASDKHILKDASSPSPILFGTKEDRGYYKLEEGRISLANKPEKWRSTAFHELGHRFEHAIPDVFQATSYFYDRRINEHLDPNTKKPREIDLTPDLPGPLKETAFDGGFFEPYAGKTYKDGDSIIAYEIVSVGCQYAYTNPLVLWEKDPDYAAFIYGILALCGQPD